MRPRFLCAVISLVYAVPVDPQFPTGRQDLVSIPSYSSPIGECRDDTCLYQMRINVVAIQYSDDGAAFKKFQKITARNVTDEFKTYLPPLRSQLQYGHFQYFFAEPLQRRVVSFDFGRSNGSLGQDGVEFMNVTTLKMSGTVQSFNGSRIEAVTAHDGFVQLIAFVKLTGHAPGSVLTFKATLHCDYLIEVFSQNYVVGTRGLTVVADIDETLKLFGKGFTNTIPSILYRDYVPIPGVTAEIQRWKSQAESVSNVSAPLFYYLSAGPWQMAPSVQEFVARAGLPPGPVECTKLNYRTFGLMDFTEALKFLDVRTIKSDAMLKRIMPDMPSRTYVLTGDSAMKDPDFQSFVMRDSVFGDRVKMSIIRKTPVATERKNSAERFRRLFGNFSQDRVLIFNDNVTALQRVDMRKILLNDTMH